MNDTERRDDEVMIMMTGPTDSQLSPNAEQDDVTLRELRAEFPDLHISTDFYGRFRAWVARGQNGQPWLVMSTDTERFRRALRRDGGG